jgi:hypothetical protein
MLKYCIAQHYVETLVRKDGHVIGVNLENGKVLEMGFAGLLIPIFSLAAAREERFNNVESSGIAPISSTAPLILCTQQNFFKHLENCRVHDFFWLSTSLPRARRHFASAREDDWLGV